MKRRLDLQAATSREQISRRAHELWQDAGRPQGRDLEFWLRAERELRAKHVRRGSGQPAASCANDVTKAPWNRKHADNLNP
ncbi:DUF2934 domain-containing protein [Bradyrhizobium sp. UFLA05-153]